MSKAEKFIEDCTKTCSNELSDVCFEAWVTPEQALRAVEIAREEELEYIKYQLELMLPETLDYNGIQVEREDFISDFVKEMKDE